MRCALKYDEEKDFSDQIVSAWGVMQSLNDDPCYKESDLNEENRKWFDAYKFGVDDSIHMLECYLENCDLFATDDIEDCVNEFKDICSAEICEMLYTLIDDQEG